MFSRVLPSWEQIERFKQPLTEGERYLLKFLDDNLKKDDSFQGNDLAEYRGWLIFVQPFLNGSRPDIVIFRPGIGVQIFEVKDWNLCHYSFETTEDGNKIFCASDSHGPYPIKSPVKQVEYYKKKIVDQLMPQIGKDFEKNPRHYGLIKTAIYFHKSKTAPAQKLFKTHSKIPVIGQDSLSRDNLGEVVPDYSRSQSSYWHKDWDREILFWLHPPRHAIEQNEPLMLTNDQKKLAEPKSGHHRVRGIAGSGKTQALAYRASNLASQGYHVLVLTYNITLWHRICDMVRRSPFVFEWRNLTITHFHRFCGDILNEFSEEWQKSSGDDDDDGNHNGSDPLFIDEIPNKVLEIIKKNEHKKYDAILIDEGQDFCVEWYSMLCHFLTSRDEVAVVCDKKQNIYERKLKWLDKRFGERLDDGQSRIAKFGDWIDLKKVFRLPEPIARFSAKFSTAFELNQDIKISKNEQLELFNEFQGHVVWWNIKSENDWLDKVDQAFEVIKNQAIHNHPSDTVILVPYKRLGPEYLRHFESKNIEVNHVFEDYDDERDHIYKKAFWMGGGRLKISTIHSFKGWEVQNVIVVIPSSLPASLHGKEQIYDSTVYTAITRAKENLIVINANKRYWKFGESISHVWE